MARFINTRFNNSQIIQRLYNYAGLARGKYQRLDVVFGVERAIHPRSGVSTGQILAINEFGDAMLNIPARPFMRTSNEIIKQKVRDIVYGMKAAGKPWVGETELEEIGLLGQATIRDTIIRWDTPSNAPRTIKRKGFNDPLIETNLLWQSVAYDILQRWN